MQVKPYKGYVAAPTGQVHFRMLGDGEPLLLLHQSPSSSLMFSRALPILAELGLQAIAIDTPGYGNSDVPAERPSVATYASVVPAVLAAFGLKQAAILGHHTGAAIACEVAVSRPELVRRLVLNGPPLYTEEERQARLARARRGPIPLRPDGSHLLERWQQRLAATPGWTDLAAMHRNVVQGLLAGEYDWYGHLAVFEYEMLPRFLALRVPTLILTNTGDDLYRFAQRAHALRPDFAYVELPGGTHDIVDEQPRAWAEAVARFVLERSDAG
ncbi:MAG: alpha/beta hydrolase [Dehalococcoidia bacterium]|nr:MAG: alpha/beta hydrolase [Dehalococcoidia bacterium]